MKKQFLQSTTLSLLGITLAFTPNSFAGSIVDKYIEAKKTQQHAEQKAEKKREQRKTLHQSINQVVKHKDSHHHHHGHHVKPKHYGHHHHYHKSKPVHVHHHYFDHNYAHTDHWEPVELVLSAFSNALSLHYTSDGYVHHYPRAGKDCRVKHYGHKHYGHTDGQGYCVVKQGPNWIHYDHYQIKRYY